MLGACAKEIRRGGEKGAGDRPRGGGFIARPVRGGKAGEGSFRRGAFGPAPGAIGAAVGRTAPETAALERATAAQASHGRGRELHARPVDRAQRLLLRWRRTHR